jgi:2-aminobenzoate-CoA ligase
MSGPTTPAGHAAITVERRVEWSDTDAAGHHHFTAILRWVEEAEFVLHDRLGVADLVAGRCPRVHVSADFKRPAYAREVLEVELWVSEVGRTSVGYGFAVRGGSGTVAEGVVTAVFVPDGRPARWPEDVRRRFLESGAVEGERFATSAADRGDTDGLA